MAPVAATIRSLEPLLKGESAWNIEKLWRRMYIAEENTRGETLYAAQNRRKRSRCYRTTVSAWTYSKGPRQIESRQNRSFAFSLEGRELQSQGSIFDRDRLLAADDEPDKSKDREEKGWHASRLFVSIPCQVKLLRADRIMANHSAQL